jgi:pyruvate/2-oxoglutarate dehydrogenase complex dihydrolipoamide dehydrogenase (E3) component
MSVTGAFDLGRKPAHLIVLGAGRDGLEIAQAYNRLGTDTTLLDGGPALPDEDPELVAVLVDRLRAEGVRVRTSVGIVSVGRRRGGVRFTVADPAGGDAAIDGSHLLIAAGRKANIAGLDLDAAGIGHDAAGIVVDGNLRTANRRVYAIGDAVAGPASVGRARYQARRVIRSILYRLPSPDRPEAVPRVTFTDPALASVGLSEAEARRRVTSGLRVLRLPFVENERAQIERLPAGFVKVIANARGRILGAAIVGHDAGESIALWSLAVANGLPLSALAAMPAPYPARAEMSRELARETAGSQVGLTASWRRRIIELLRKFG